MSSLASKPSSTTGLGVASLADGRGFHAAVTYPQALLLAGILDVVEADGAAVLLEFVFDLASQRHGLGSSQVDVAVLQSLAIVDGDGNEAAGFGLAFVAGPLKDGDGAQVWRVFGLLDHLAGILGTGGRGREQERDDERCLSGKTSLEDLR